MARKTGPTAATVDMVRERAGGLCEVCGCAEVQQFHHRKPRGMGGTRDASINSETNILGCCFPCHAGIESHRAESYDKGYLVRTSAVPANIPVLSRGTWKFLEIGGGYAVQLAFSE